jgi:hypothetical protein
LTSTFGYLGKLLLGFYWQAINWVYISNRSQNWSKEPVSRNFASVYLILLTAMRYSWLQCLTYRFWSQYSAFARFSHLAWQRSHKFIRSQFAICKAFASSTCAQELGLPFLIDKNKDPAAWCDHLNTCCIKLTFESTLTTPKGLNSKNETGRRDLYIQARSAKLSQILIWLGHRARGFCRFVRLQSTHFRH